MVSSPITRLSSGRTLYVSVVPPWCSQSASPQVLRSILDSTEGSSHQSAILKPALVLSISHHTSSHPGCDPSCVLKLLDPGTYVVNLRQKLSKERRLFYGSSDSNNYFMPIRAFCCYQSLSSKNFKFTVQNIKHITQKVSKKVILFCIQL